MSGGDRWDAPCHFRMDLLSSNAVAPLGSVDPDRLLWLQWLFVILCWKAGTSPRSAHRKKGEGDEAGVVYSGTRLCVVIVSSHAPRMCGGRFALNVRHNALPACQVLCQPRRRERDAI